MIILWTKKKPENQKRKTTTATTKKFHPIYEYCILLLNDLFVLVWIMTSMVGILFWSIYFYDREMIFPKSFDNVYPQELNMFQHGYLAVLMWLEWLMLYHAIEPTKHIKIILVFGIGYLVWVYIQKIFIGFPYPLFEAMDIRGHVIFDVCAIVATVTVFYVLNYVHAVRWKGRKLSQKVQ